MAAANSQEKQKTMSSSSSKAQSQLQSPPYPSAARIADSQCYPQYTASLKCLEEFSSDKSKCQEHFDVYKECKKKEYVRSVDHFPDSSFYNHATMHELRGDL
ncbi:hypothetical protein ACH5RR_000465 [Cinchona calisaya]|uniref:CHCH domain-containing protein n=1 Tax=Cinchona calisaya TaxID=153742 RepID=A0ABD3B0W5_9GENT